MIETFRRKTGYYIWALIFLILGTLILIITYYRYEYNGIYITIIVILIALYLIGRGINDLISKIVIENHILSFTNIHGTKSIDMRKIDNIALLSSQYQGRRLGSTYGAYQLQMYGEDKHIAIKDFHAFKDSEHIKKLIKTQGISEILKKKL